MQCLVLTAGYFLRLSYAMFSPDSRIFSWGCPMQCLVLTAGYFPEVVLCNV